MPCDIPPRLVPIRTAPLWLRRAIVILAIVPAAIRAAFTTDIDADVAAIDMLWSR